MSATVSAPGAQQQRFAAYLDSLAQAAEHADRVEPLKSYCKGLLLPGERKSVEPMAARLAPDHVRQTHQSLHHLVADAPWSDEALLVQVRHSVLPTMKRNGPVIAWIVDDTGFPKKGTHSVGVTHQYCGQLGKQENCRVAVSLSMATEHASLPIAYRLYLPETWAQDQKRRKKAGVPEQISFATKPVIALGQIRQALADGVTAAPVLADAAYGDETKFREQLSELGLSYVVGVRGHTTVWRPGETPLPAKPGSGLGRPPKLLRRDRNHQPVSVQQVALSLPAKDWRAVSWRQGTKQKLRSRFAALRVRPAHRDYWRSRPRDEEWLLIEWPERESEPTKYWLSTFPARTTLRELVKRAKHRWIIERDYQELKQGWTSEEALGRPIADVLRIIDAVSGTVVGNQVENMLQENKNTRALDYSNSVLVQRDGCERGIENTVALTHDQDGDVTGAVVAFHDVSAARIKSLEMTHLAHHDVLTSLPNRILFNDRLVQALSLAERQGKQLALMFVDLDHFKKVNDSLGHEVGDKLLQSIAGRLVDCMRRTDTVCRLGGDEFVILLSQVEHAEDAALSARNVLRALSKPHIINDKSLDINVSVGLSTYPDDGGNAETLISKADTAMYEAKRHGRNNYQFFRPDMQARLIERQSMELSLRYALGRNEFLLHYQPKLNLRTGRITGVEALIRWAHPQRGMVYPLQFIPIAEECGLILSIGRWVLLEACKQARAWNDSGLGVVPMAVNVSAAEFADKDFLSGVRAVLIATGVEPANLELELTESVLMHDAESTVGTLMALKAMGVQLAIDDFGTGYSSFSYLRRFPLDVLKLHQSFVQGITEDQSEGPLLNAMINVGKSLKQRVVAEGVETRAQLEFLRRHECDEGQGYYFSRPVAAEKAAKLVEASTREVAIEQA